MKKLNKMEIGALASKIGSELRKDYNDKVEREKEIHKERFYETPLGKAVLNLMKFPEWEDLLSEYELNKLYRKGHSFDSPACLSDIENAIIIAQIDCPDLETLIQTVKKSLV